MAISAQQRQFLTSSLQGAIAKHYGDDVPTLQLYTRQRRATFIEKLKEQLQAPLWYSKVAAAKAVLGHALGVQTKLKNNQRVNQEELRAERDEALAKVEAQYQAEFTKLTLKYEPALSEQYEAVNGAQQAANAVERASYFAALGEEDDGRRIYGSDTSFDGAISQRVDRYIENSLDDDAMGKQVAQRIEEERLVGDVAYIAKNVEAMREAILGFIRAGDLPAITMKAWGIVEGKDVLAS